MDQTQLIALLSNPLTFGALVSWILEQTSFFKNEKNPPVQKIGIVLAVCLVWAVAMAALSDAGLPLTVAGWRNVLSLGIAVAVGSQVFHLLVNALLPGITDFVLSLKAVPATVSVASSSTTTTTNGTTTETVSAAKSVDATIDTVVVPSKAAAEAIPNFVTSDGMKG